MDYEKAYSSHLDAAKVIFNSDNTSFEVKEALRCIFPELAESEDERIRKALIKFFRGTDNWANLKYSGKEIVAYLEKQKEQKPEQETWPNLSNCIHDCKNCMGKCFYRKEKYQEQKPAEWSEEDELYINAIICMCKGEFVSEGSRQQILSWLKSLHPQLKQEWTDKDWNDIETIATHLDNMDNPALAESLRSIRRKIFWKPSEEQMGALYSVLPLSGQPTTLQSLYNDLKKL